MQLILLKQIIDLIGKEEMLEVESRIEKILGKLPIMEVNADAANPVETKPVIEDITLKEDEELKDKAVELYTEEVEEHIAEMFSRPATSEIKPDTKVESAKKVKEEDLQIMSRFTEDNSVKDLDECMKDKEEAPVKVNQKNGSK